MITSSNGNIFRVPGPLWGESTGDWLIPLTKANDIFFDLCLNRPNRLVGQTIETLVILDTIALIMTSL